MMSDPAAQVTDGQKYFRAELEAELEAELPH
ncbi:hypothetical protein FB472_2020 [Rhodoglobus vestalii]|uniref:Uncharacterized protein n=1 Tax=Rhodoglobus vestalii TaxID=193384 RepID=A0A8H2K7R2_9MICO|nr:hypothetical protein FB472_2020 [Rhodoglobus vestalii]